MELKAAQMQIVRGSAQSVRDTARHGGVHAIAFEYTEWDPATESYGCRGVWRNANLVLPLARSTAIYPTETEAVAAAAQAFLDMLKA